MDIVERLRLQEETGLLNLPDNHEFVYFGQAADEIERLRDNDILLKDALIRIYNILREGAPWTLKMSLVANEINAALNPTIYELGDIEVDGQPTEQEEWKDFDPDC